MRALLSLFDFNGTDVRVITQSGEPWFVAKDVCGALDLSNSRASVHGLLPGTYRNIVKSSVANSDVSFPNRGMQCVSERGLYRLLFLSRKKAAIDFQEWVTGTVRPAIRKDGGYVMGEEKMATGEMSELQNIIARILHELLHHITSLHLCT